MLARSTTLLHPSGTRLNTPLLIPSFSSKGFGTSTNGDSEVKKIMLIAEEFLTDSMLLSAYDIHHGHVNTPAGAITEVVVVDSGGYETSDLQDLSATYVTRVEKQDWSEALLYKTLDSWPTYAPAIFVTYDSTDQPTGLHEQIDRARRMRSRYPGQLHTFLIKPETSEQKFVQMRNVLANVEELSAAHIIGLTEKELGSSFIERMERVALLRLALDDAKLNHIPIHIFGSLDPISVCLYFISGAEIFDGLSWLRYGYHEGAAMYIHNYAVREHLIHKRDDFAKAASIRSNLNVLATLTIQMRKVLKDGDYRHLDPAGTWLQEAYDQLRTKVGRL